MAALKGAAAAPLAVCGLSGLRAARLAPAAAPPRRRPAAAAAAPPPRRAVRASAAVAAAEAPPRSREGEVLAALSTIIDPDFGMSIVDCGFVKDLAVDAAGAVAFRLELTTPACPVKGEFERAARANVSALPWVTAVALTMDARAAPALAAGDGDAGRPGGLARVAHVVAVSSCKGGVGKSTTAVNLAYTLAGMGARVGILDADVYGPSLPTMISPDPRVLVMDPETKAISPCEYEGVKAVSFGFAGQGSAIMRGPMVSGLISQLLTTTDWGALDYLVVDFPPGTGDIQLTLCQSVAFSAAVVVTTPQKLAFVDVAKGVRMFARLAVPCVAVVENMAYFDADGKRHLPFGAGSGERVAREFGVPNLVRFPIVPALSAAGDGGRPLVVADPAGETAQAFLELGAAVVREVAKLARAPRNAVRYDAALRCFVVRPPGAALMVDGDSADAAADASEFCLDPVVVRRNDTSARSIDEWTGARLSADADVPDGVEPASVAPVGNYAAQIVWADGFAQVAPYELLASLPRLARGEVEARRAAGEAAAAAAAEAAEAAGPAAEASAAQRILAAARPLEVGR
jgi:Mrp family chromosome partitioning ATPase